jgi:hypothetical protein
MWCFDCAFILATTLIFATSAALQWPEMRNGVAPCQTIRLERAVHSPPFRKKRATTDPEFCEGLKILLVSSGDCVFLAHAYWRAFCTDCSFRNL